MNVHRRMYYVPHCGGVGVSKQWCGAQLLVGVKPQQVPNTAETWELP